VIKAYLIGEAAKRFAKSLGSKVPHEICGTLNMAVTAAARDAARHPGSDPVVLLSPACASFDQFKNFEARGEDFISSRS
jgi:UDP-N-acetylmuramoylalanine--D-glutamate ligase